MIKGGRSPINAVQILNLAQELLGCSNRQIDNVARLAGIQAMQNSADYQNSKKILNAMLMERQKMDKVAKVFYGVYSGFPSKETVGDKNFRITTNIKTNGLAVDVDHAAWSILKGMRLGTGGNLGLPGALALLGQYWGPVTANGIETIYTSAGGGIQGDGAGSLSLIKPGNARSYGDVAVLQFVTRLSRQAAENWRNKIFAAEVTKKINTFQFNPNINSIWV
jgi:hypothetical protein